MDFVPLLSTVPLAVIVTASRRPWPRDIRPRLAAELGLIVAGGTAGVIVGGSTGGMVAPVGLAPLVVHQALARRVGRLQRLEQP